MAARATSKKEEKEIALVATTVLRIVKNRGPQYIHYRVSEFHSVTAARGGSDRCFSDLPCVLGLYDSNATLQDVAEDCREALINQNFNMRIKLR